MPKFQGSPVFDMEKELKIDNERLKELQKMVETPKSEKKFKPGTIYLTRNYPGYEGTVVFLHVSDYRRGDGGLVRVTGELPAIPPRPEEMHTTCPNCRKAFPQGYLFVPGYSGLGSVEIDTTYSEADFSKFLEDVKATVSSAG